MTDLNTGLMWQQGDDQNDSGRTWQQAMDYCADRDLGGHSDWRLPTRKEVLSVVDYGRWYPAINATYFPDCRSVYYWSSSTLAFNPANAWVVNFYYGGSGWASKNGHNDYVRCVRGRPSIAQSPMCGPRGTTFVQWCMGFTLNGTATLHFRKPDGTEYPTRQVDLDSIGHFEVSYTAPWNTPPGTYTWWAIDDTTGDQSNEVSYQIAAKALGPDFNLNLRTDLTLWSPTLKRWFGKDSVTGTRFDKMWGSDGDIPLAGDYDGDCMADVAVFQPETGQWTILTAGSDFVDQIIAGWGFNGDLPLGCSPFSALQDHLMQRKYYP